MPFETKYNQIDTPLQLRSLNPVLVWGKFSKVSPVVFCYWNFYQRGET